MSEKKHIDRLFQEKFKDFEVAPNDSVWDNIHSALQKKDEDNRKFIPLWWKLGGVAAMLALLLAIGIKLMSNDSNSNTDNTVVETEKQALDKSDDASQSDDNNPNDPKNISKDFDTQIDNSSKVADEDGSKSEEIINGASHETVNSRTEQNKSNDDGLNASDANRTAIANKSNNGSIEKNVVDTSNGFKNPSKDESGIRTKDAIAIGRKASKNNSFQNTDAQKIEKSEIDKLIEDSKNNNNSAVTKASERWKTYLPKKKIEEEKTDKSIENAIADTHIEEEKDEKEKKLNRWNISPNVAPVYFNSLGKGSPIDEQFVNNAKEGDVTMSYGVGGSYAINDRLKVRAGVNKVDLGYSTDNVIAFNSIDQTSAVRGQINNISVNNNSEKVTYLSSESLNRNITPEIINTKAQGAINQRFGFIELPLEMEYALINSKFGLNVIGGFSTLLVDKNEIYSVIDGNQTLIGEANNINNLSYSANFGLGVNYNISDKIKVNVEPTFKYQIDTFNNSSGDFKPFFIGVYTGLSYKF